MSINVEESGEKEEGRRKKEEGRTEEQKNRKPNTNRTAEKRIRGTRTYDGMEEEEFPDSR
jgi:hypothetical protein